MSDAADKKGAGKKGGGKKKMIILLGAVALLGGGGAAAGFFVAGSMHKETGPHEDPNKPQLVLKGENPEEIANQGLAKAKEAGAAALPEGKGVDLPRPQNPAAYQPTYFQIPAPFTSNLAESDAFAQISIAVSTYYDNRVIQAVQSHELAIRSAILMMMAQQNEIDLSTPQGKEALQQKLLEIINGTLKAKTGYGGVDNVYFTNFVIQ
ncbi:flagellar basal body-associated FliL family protein [Sphingobium lignivorans]|uniref:Flagellar protein FliL n=1 Tax=Sphingobium lignivorans TaxID=2735886 RepID=A0ABR6NAI1_9SPHN|nr:flagellar basal body-associated FliL family protein [Sphingobium lignivorans]MBB5984286.1 flagellar FliL protein [Sphingobium lignivorans]